MKILIAGAAGFLGTHLVNALVPRGHEVTAIDLPGQGPRLTGQGCVFLPANLGRDGSPPACGPQDVAIYLAQAMDYRNWPSAAPNVIDVNVAGLTRFAETARLAGVRHFIFASSASIYRPSFEPLNEESPVLARDIYSLSKQFGEELLKLYEEYFVVTSLRLFALYGPGQRQRMFPNIVTRVLRGEPVDLQPRTRGEERPTGLTITPIHVADAAEVVCGLMERPFRGAINVASPEAVSVRRLAEDAGTMVGKPPVFRVDEKPRPGDLIADIRRLRDLVPMTFRPFGDGLRDVVEDLADRNPIVG